ncbi:TolC family protein [Fuerstiella marisgermanici]|uniref:Outer membrane protein TolC n=1 Tax=Fuerstiella marisgermanici TaxID=1891926 RepID=A0A1P8WIM3_9PLAN|nr:TolC family protein [Fuerstiella marisgermanici]APZ93887.1 Outer membrane protein TolC precursor [Fuerstiella marisgermanici]
MPPLRSKKSERQSARARGPMLSTVTRFFCASSLLTTMMLGCSTQKATVCDLKYCDDKEGIEHYVAKTSAVAYPCLDNQTAEAVATSTPPRNLLRRSEDAPREITLNEALRIALTHNQVIETSALGGIGSKQVLTSPATATSVYDPAIQASGVLFGRRSVEAALADFDANFTSTLNFSRDDLVGGNLNGNGNRADFTSSLSKQFATAGTISLNHDWTHTTDPIGYSGETPNYYGRIGVEVRQPLLAGSGTAYTRIAGPANPNFGAITGVSQGVVIARINEDISIADFEVTVRDAMRDIEHAYWDLYNTYRAYDTAVVAHKSAFQTWREAKDRLEVGVLKPADELQARDRLYETKSQVEVSLNTLFKAETELRRLIGLPMNDGTVLRPIDEPVLAELIPDWESSLREGLTHRVELRRQKWTIKSQQLQLQAARSLVRPRLDILAGYDVNGAGDTLVSQSSSPFRSAYGSMNDQNINSWNAGFQFSIPVGLRYTRSQVRNLELQVAKASAVLASQEKNIAHDIATAIQDVTASYATAQTNYTRLKAATRRVTLLEAEREVGTLTLDLVLRAQASVAAAESAYYQQIVNYSKAITSLHLAKGTLLEHNGIMLAEGQWQPEAYCDALVRAHARTHAKEAPYLCTEPQEFVSPGPTGTVDLRSSIQLDSTVPEYGEITPVPAADSNIEAGDAADPMTQPAEASEIQVPAPPEKPSVDAGKLDGAGADKLSAAVNSPKPRMTMKEPLPIYDPLKDYDNDPPRAASAEDRKLLDLDIFKR